jgi:hypothetical protein
MCERGREEKKREREREGGRESHMQALFPERDWSKHKHLLQPDHMKMM